MTDLMCRGYCLRGLSEVRLEDKWCKFEIRQTDREPQSSHAAETSLLKCDDAQYGTSQPQQS